jgi:hypothetical protein
VRGAGRTYVGGDADEDETGRCDPGRDEEAAWNLGPPVNIGRAAFYRVVSLDGR